MNNQKNIQRLNIGLSGHNVVNEANELRAKLEVRLKQRLAMAQVIKRLIKMALAEENQSS
jgi:hypothetical protein